MLSVWDSCVKKELKLIKQKRSLAIRKEWTNNWQKVDGILEQNDNQTPNIKWPITTTANPIQTVILKPVEPIPRQSNWVLTTRNTMVDNANVLHNIPFIEDDAFIKSLVRSYDGKVHDEEKYPQLDDVEFLQLVDTLQSKYMPLKERKIIPDPIIFKSISKFCADEATPEQLTDRYIKHIFAKNEAVKNEIVATATKTCDETLGIFRKYFCRRCFIYNCELHRNTGNTSISNSIFLSTFTSNVSGWKRPEGKVEPRKKPCSSRCYMLENVDSVGTESIWTEDDKQLYCTFQRIFPENYCAIAQMMLTKSCQAVHAFSHSEVMEDLPIVPKVEQKPLPAKKLPSNPKQWRSHHFKRLSRNSETRRLHSYLPCTHSDGNCCQDCSCITSNNFCEKFCNCRADCFNRFIGCRCKSNCKTKACPCYTAHRECDPDICKCSAAERELLCVQCKNVSIQRGIRKYLLMAPSTVAGWGIFLKDGAKRGEYISEYCGEIITQGEADRRGKVYDKLKCSYLFELNEEYVVDATNKGSKMRFANHSNNPNCYAKVLMVLGDHRIGIFAERDILPHEELFFDYRYGPIERLKFVAIERDVE